MQEPRTRIVGRPSYHHLLPRVASAYHIATNWVHIIEGTAACALYDIKSVLMIIISNNHTCQHTVNLPHEGVWDAGKI
jgi:hypothetical protein